MGVLALISHRTKLHRECSIVCNQCQSGSLVSTPEGSPTSDIFVLAEILDRQFGGVISIVASKFTNVTSVPLLNITAKTATKTEALGRLLTPHGISLDDTMAIGDDLPDLEMLQACGIPVAMANSFPEVKAACLYQTASDDEDGVAVVLET